MLISSVQQSGQSKLILESVVIFHTMCAFKHITAMDMNLEEDFVLILEYLFLGTPISPSSPYRMKFHVEDGHSISYWNHSAGSTFVEREWLASTHGDG